MRLKEIVPDLPLLTRAKDAEGERDVSFLDALTNIVHDQSRVIGDGEKIEGLQTSILQRANKDQEARRTREEQTAVHLALSELAERRDMLARHIKSKPPRKSLWKWFLSLLKLLHVLRAPVADPLQPVAEGASIREIDGRMSELRALVEDPAGAILISGCNHGIYVRAQRPTEAEARHVKTRRAHVSTNFAGRAIMDRDR